MYRKFKEQDCHSSKIFFYYNDNNNKNLDKEINICLDDTNDTIYPIFVTKTFVHFSARTFFLLSGTLFAPIFFRGKISAEMHIYWCYMG